MKIIPKLSKFPVFGFWFKFEVQEKVKGEIKIVGISGVNFGNLQINFELKTSGDHIWHINISYFANHIGLAISTEEKKPLTFQYPLQTAYQIQLMVNSISWKFRLHRHSLDQSD